MSFVIALFARAPIPGRAKTRLIPALGAEGAAALHERMVADALPRLDGIGELELHTDEATAAWPAYEGIRKLQVPGDLGAKMLAVLSERPHTMIVGGDAPAIPRSYLEALRDSPADVAIGPTEDGGYYAISARRADPRMFEGVEWSSGRELRQTIAACERCGLSVFLGSWWFDIDTVEDLDRARTAGILTF